MAMKYGFFNAVQQSDGSYDREYDAAFFTELLNTNHYNAVTEGSFMVSADSGLTLSVGSGRGFVNGVFFYDNSPSTLTCTSASGTRTDLVVAALNTAARTVGLTVKVGTTSAAENEVALATVTVTGATVTDVSNINYTQFVKNVPVITFGTADPDNNTSGDIYLKIVG